MSYKIVVDSCCELPAQYHQDEHYEIVPLGLEVEDELIMDDESFDQASFLKKVAESSKCPKSFCPSPEKFMEAYRTEAENIFVFTLSAKLSGSYNSAEVGKKLYEEKYGKKNIFICDSESASCGESQQALLAARLSEEGLPFEEICRKLTDYRDHMKTYFVLDNLETLRKNGRLTGVKALAKMADTVAKEAVDPDKKTLMITHCNCRERAESVKNMILARIKCKDVLIMDTRGVSSMYANDGGVIVTL